LVIHREPQFVSAGNNVLMPVAPLRAKMTLPQLFYRQVFLALLLGLALRLFFVFAISFLTPARVASPNFSGLPSSSNTHSDFDAAATPFT